MEQLALLPFDLFEKLQGVLRDGLRHKANRTEAKHRLEILQEQLQSTNRTLSYREKQISQIRNIPQSKINDCEFQLDKCKTLINTITKHIGEIEKLAKSKRARFFPSTINDLLASAKEEFEQLNRSIGGLNEMTGSFHDGFIVVRDMVPENPSRILLDFDDENTPEASLKKAIFDKDSQKTTVCAVASGMGGVGKTCALRAIGNLDEACERFPGGVLYMSLGSDATKEDLIRNLAKFVKTSGGKEECIEIENGKDLNEAIRTAAKWFEGQICLFLIDDIWRQNGIPSAVTQMLKKLITHEDSRMALTTRDRELECYISVAFSKREVPDAEKLLMYTAGLGSQSPSKEAMNAVKSLIEVSGGLPIALHAIGCHAKNLMNNRKKGEGCGFQFCLEDCFQRI